MASDASICFVASASEHRWQHAGQLPLLDYGSIESPNFVRAATAAAALGVDSGNALVSAAEKSEMQFRTGRRMVLTDADFAGDQDMQPASAGSFRHTTRRCDMLFAAASDAEEQAEEGDGTGWSAYDEDDGADVSGGYGGHSGAAACAGFDATATGDISDRLFGLEPATSDELSAALEARMFGGASGHAPAASAGAAVDDLEASRRLLESRLFGNVGSEGDLMEELDDYQTALDTRLFGSTTAIANAAVNAFMGDDDDDLDASRAQLETRLFGASATTASLSQLLDDSANPELEESDELETARELLTSRLFGAPRAQLGMTQSVATGGESDDAADATAAELFQTARQELSAASADATRASTSAALERGPAELFAQAQQDLAAVEAASSNFGRVPTIPGYNPLLAGSIGTLTRARRDTLDGVTEVQSPVLGARCAEVEDSKDKPATPLVAANEFEEDEDGGSRPILASAMAGLRRTQSDDAGLDVQRTMLETRLFGTAVSAAVAADAADLEEEREMLTTRLFGTAHALPADDHDAQDELDARRTELTTRLFGTAEGLEDDADELDMGTQRRLLETRLFGLEATGDESALDELDNERDLLTTRLFGRSGASTARAQPVPVASPDVAAGEDAAADDDFVELQQRAEAQALAVEVAALQEEAEEMLQETQAARSARASRAGEGPSA